MAIIPFKLGFSALDNIIEEKFSSWIVCVNCFSCKSVENNLKRLFLAQVWDSIGQSGPT